MAKAITHKQKRQIQLVDVIIRNARRLQKLTEDILDITKIETRKLQLKKEQCNLNDIIKNCISDIISNNDSFKKNEKYNTIKLLYQPKDIFIQADRARITQVISNLLSNAVKFTSEGTISISLEQKTEEQGKRDDNDGNVVVIAVKDTGQSIHPDILPKLFTKFATKSETGTGLGLYISKSIVESHGGKIWAKNNADGKGAIFTFSLPVYKKDQ